MANEKTRENMLSHLRNAKASECALESILGRGYTEEDALVKRSREFIKESREEAQDIAEYLNIPCELPKDFDENTPIGTQTNMGELVKMDEDGTAHFEKSNGYKGWAGKDCHVFVQIW